VHHSAQQFVENTVRMLNLNRPGLTVLEIGSYNVNGTVRGAFSRTDYTGVDFEAGPGVDVVADITQVEWEPEKFDVVVCCEVLEHIEEPLAIVEAAHLLLKPSGVLILTCASPGRPRHSGRQRPFDPEVDFYRNVKEEQLDQWVAMFDRHIITRKRHHCDFHVVAWKRNTEQEVDIE